MIDSINTNNISEVSESTKSSQGFDQDLINQLLMFILGCNSNPPGGGSPQEDALKAELTQLESSLPPDQAAQLKQLLDELPTDTGSKTYYSELTEAFSKITAFVASVIPNGLSPDAKEQLKHLLSQMPVDTSSKTYPEEVAAWAAHVSAFVASNLPGVLSPADQKELNDLLGEEPTDTSSKDYPSEMQKFMDTVQVFLAERLPSSLSQADKDKLDTQLKKIQGIDIDSKEGPVELQFATAELEQMLSGMFF